MTKTIDINNKKSKVKIIAVTMLMIIASLNFINSVYAYNMTSANLYNAGECGDLLTYKGTVVKTTYIEFIDNGRYFPAYCLDKTKPGVETQQYSVNVSQAITDVGLWKIIINGHPYKSLEELQVANVYEAFAATKHAIYCYIHGNNPNDYGAIGEAGQRTLNAMYRIIQNANNSNETQISSTINIEEVTNNWEQDNQSKNYVSKTYKVNARANIQNYKITLSRPNGRDIGGVKLTDLNNNEKQEFAPNEQFKILIPIKNMTDNGELNIKVDAQIETKPVLYGTAPDSSYQDYALATFTYEDGTGSINARYNKNETKIIIIKQDSETKERLEGVEFELLDENKKVVYANLKTDKEGKIVVENLVPGKYYLKETNTLNDYDMYRDLISLNVSLNERFTVTINNNKKDIPKIEVTENELTTSNKEIKKLPVTGM